MKVDFYTQNLYINFEANFLEVLKKNSNLLIVTLPGFGISYFLKKLIEKNAKLNLSYISEIGDRLTTYNILDLNFDKNKDVLKIADNYFKLANLKQKFALVINTPQILETSKYKDSYLSSHIYKTYYFRAREEKDSNIFATEINPALKMSEVKQIYQLTGGVGNIIKFFAINEHKINLDTKTLLEDKDLLKILEPTVEQVEKSSEDVLVKLNIMKDGNFVGGLLREYFKRLPRSEKINIKLHPDLGFSEDGLTVSQRLTKVEFQILEFALQNGGIVSKEKVADYKWGIKSYNAYSDQAVGKTIQRLRKKILRYDIEVLPKFGYKIVRRK